MPTRVYVVSDLQDPSKPPRLVDATYEHTALRHVSLGRYAARIANKQDLVKLGIEAGIKVEYADAHAGETQEPLPLSG